MTLCQGQQPCTYSKRLFRHHCRSVPPGTAYSKSGKVTTSQQQATKENQPSCRHAYLLLAFSEAMLMCRVAVYNMSKERHSKRKAAASNKLKPTKLSPCVPTVGVWLGTADVPCRREQQIQSGTTAARQQQETNKTHQAVGNPTRKIWKCNQIRP